MEQQHIGHSKIPVMSFVASSGFVGFVSAPLTPTPNPTLYTGRGITVEDTGTSTVTFGQLFQGHCFHFICIIKDRHVKLRNRGS